MKIKRNMIVWAELKSGLRHIQAGRRPCIVISCDKANGKSPVYTVVPGTTKLKKDYIPVHFNIEPSEIRGFLRHTTMFIYSCIRCQYRGTEEDVLEKNEMIRFRYKAMHDRITKFDFD